MRVTARPNTLDRVISWFSPSAGLRRLQARAGLAAANSWSGASKVRRTLRGWTTAAGDADSDTLPDLPTLRERSRDLLRDNPIACGAIGVQVTSIVGTGLQLRAQINRETLGLDDEQADAWERLAEAEWNLFAGPECDIERTLNFAAIQELAMRSVLESGDVFITSPMVRRRPSPYATRLQLIEADRVCNRDDAADSSTLSGGILRDAQGAPVIYQIMTTHPGSAANYRREWRDVPAFGKATGRRNVLHLYHKRRPGQSRGVPCLAPVIEEIKQLGRYTEAEVQAAVVASFFAVFVKTPVGTGLAAMETSDGGRTESAADYRLSSGAILDLAPGEDVTFANPMRPNTAFDSFVQAMIVQIGMALELPYEVLVKRFNASYSASKAALLEAWRFFTARRKWLADSLCRPVYELFLDEAVALGRIPAPGYLNGDPLVRAAWLGSEWVGPARGDIDEVNQIEAAARRIELGVSSRSRETAAITGGDWEREHIQLAKESKRREADGLVVQKSEDRGQKPEDGGQKTEDGGQKTEADEASDGEKDE